MKPYVICLMITSPDGGLHPSKWTASPDGTRDDWMSLYEGVHKELNGDAWMVGRATMAEITTEQPHAPSGPYEVQRPAHFVKRSAASYAIALDKSGKLHFANDKIDGDHIVVLLGPEVDDSHLAELANDGVSYLVSDTSTLDVGKMLEILGNELGIRRILLEGGGQINGSLIAEGLVDELHLVIAPALDARAGSDKVIAYGAEGLAGKAELSLIGCEQRPFGSVLLRYAVYKPK